MGLGTQVPQRVDEGDSEWQIVDDIGTIHLRRRTEVLETATQIDVFAGGWGVTLGVPLKEPLVAAIVKGQPVSILNQWVACFYPPFSIVEWRMEPGIHR